MKPASEIISSYEKQMFSRTVKESTQTPIIKCPFCGDDAQWVENKAIYGRNYGESFMCYFCAPCDAYVGCHQNTRRPLGTMANKELREWRIKAHANIDKYWKEDGMKRGTVYAKLKEKLGREIHVGESDLETAKILSTIIL